MLDIMLNEFYSIGKSLSSETDPFKLFEKIVNSSMKLTQADACTLYIVVDKKTGQSSQVKDHLAQGKRLKFAISRNTSMEMDLQDFTAPISQKSISGYTVLSGQSLNIRDAYHLGKDVEYRHSHSMDKSTGYKTKSILSIPMKNRNNYITGVIQLINKKRAWDIKIDYHKADATNDILAFNDQDEQIMNSLAGQAAVALENSQLYKGMQDLLNVSEQQNSELLYLSKKTMKAHEEERKRIAREIHDGPAQAVVNLSFRLEICKRLLMDGKKDELAGEIEKLGKSIRSTVKEMRGIIYDLKPTFLEEGLIKAVQRYIEVFSDENGIQVNFKVSGDDLRTEYYITSTVYRIIQEALTNVKKHAEARQVTIRLDISNTGILLQVSDDGRGFQMEDLKTGHLNRMKGGFGLEGIRERAELVRGSTTIKSAPGQGTAIFVEIPFL